MPTPNTSETTLVKKPNPMDELVTAFTLIKDDETQHPLVKLRAIAGLNKKLTEQVHLIGMRANLNAQAASKRIGALETQLKELVDMINAAVAGSQAPDNEPATVQEPSSAEKPQTEPVQAPAAEQTAPKEQKPTKVKKTTGDVK